MVNIYAVEVNKDADVLHIWIPADEVPPVPFIEKQLTSREVALLARQIVTTHKVRITYSGDDIPTLLQHLAETYEYSLTQIVDIILWCGQRMPQYMHLDLLERALR